MALMPAYRMAEELPKDRQSLPVLTVLYRNAGFIQASGGRPREVLRPVEPAKLPEGQPGSEVLRDAVRRRSMPDADRTFAGLCQGPALDAFHALLPTLHDRADEVHRVVLVHRAWETLDVVGREQAQTLLRQSVHYCVRQEDHKNNFGTGIRTLLPRLFDQHKLQHRELGKRQAEDAWVEKMSQAIIKAPADQAAGLVAEAVVEGWSADSIHEAISLVANQLILRDNEKQIYGASWGVHACDAMNAWRNITRVANSRSAIVSLLSAAYGLADPNANAAGSAAKLAPRPRPDALARVKAVAADALLQEAEDAIRNQDQDRACAVVARYGEQGHAARPVFDLLLRYIISEDGDKHSEKYYRTVTEEFAATRPAFRWRQLVGLARYAASAYGRPAPGYAEVCKLLKL